MSFLTATQARLCGLCVLRPFFTFVIASVYVFALRAVAPEHRRQVSFQSMMCWAAREPDTFPKATAPFSTNCDVWSRKIVGMYLCQPVPGRLAKLVVRAVASGFVRSVTYQASPRFVNNLIAFALSAPEGSFGTRFIHSRQSSSNGLSFGHVSWNTSLKHGASVLATNLSRRLAQARAPRRDFSSSRTLCSGPSTCICCPCCNHDSHCNQLCCSSGRRCCHICCWSLAICPLLDFNHKGGCFALLTRLSGS